MLCLILLLIFLPLFYPLRLAAEVRGRRLSLFWLTFCFGRVRLADLELGLKSGGQGGFAYPLRLLGRALPRLYLQRLEAAIGLPGRGAGAALTGGALLAAMNAGCAVLYGRLRGAAGRPRLQVSAAGNISLRAYAQARLTLGEALWAAFRTWLEDLRPEKGKGA